MRVCVCGIFSFELEVETRLDPPPTRVVPKLICMLIPPPFWCPPSLNYFHYQVLQLQDCYGKGRITRLYLVTFFVMPICLCSHINAFYKYCYTLHFHCYKQFYCRTSQVQISSRAVKFKTCAIIHPFSLRSDTLPLILLVQLNYPLI